MIPLSRLIVSGYASLLSHYSELAERSKLLLTALAGMNPSSPKSSRDHARSCANQWISILIRPRRWQHLVNRTEIISLASIILACLVQILAPNPALLLTLLGVGYLWALSPRFGRYKTAFHLFVPTILIPNFIISSLVVFQSNWSSFLLGKSSLLDLLTQGFAGSSFFSLSAVSYGLSSAPSSLLYSYYSPLAVGFLFALALTLALPFLTLLTLKLYSLFSATLNFIQGESVDGLTASISPAVQSIKLREAVHDSISLRLSPNDFGRAVALAVAFSLNLLLLPNLQVLQEIRTPAGVVLLPLLSFFTPVLGLVGLTLEKSGVVFKGEHSPFSRRYFSFVSKFIPVAIAVQGALIYVAGESSTLNLLWPMYYASVGATLALLPFLPIYTLTVSRAVNGSMKYRVIVTGMFVASLIAYYALFTQRGSVLGLSTPFAQESTIVVLLAWGLMSQLWTVFLSKKKSGGGKQGQ